MDQLASDEDDELEINTKIFIVILKFVKNWEP